MSKKNIILLIVIAVGIIIYFAVHKSLRNYSTEDKSKFAQVFKAFDKNSIDKIEVKRFMNLIEIKRKNDKWVVVDTTVSKKYLADEDNVDRLLDDLDSLTVLDLVSTNKESHFKMKVDTLQGAHITLFNGNNVVMDVIIGGMAGYGSTYIRPAKSDNVYEIKGMLMRYSSINDWRNKTIAKVMPEQIKSFDFDYPKNSYSIEKVDSGWQISDNKTDKKFMGDSMKVVNMLRMFGNFRASAFAKLPDDTSGIDFSKPTYHGKITTNDGKQISFSAYKMAKNDNNLIIKSDADSVYYRTYKGMLTRLAKNDLNSLKKTAMASQTKKPSKPMIQRKPNVVRSKVKSVNR